MTDGDPLCLLSVPASAGRVLSTPAVADALAYFDPDGVWLPGDADARLLAATRATATVPVVAPATAADTVSHHRFVPGEGVVAAGGDADGDAAETTPDAVLDLLTVQTVAALDDAATALQEGALRPTTDTTLLVVADLAVEHDPTTLSAGLPGSDAIAAVRDAADGGVVVLAGGQPAGYHHRWTVDGAAVTIHGLGATAGPGDPTLSALTCTPDGAVAAETVGADEFGLRALRGVGERTAEALRGRGIEDRADVAATPVEELAALPGIGRETASELHAHADVVARGEPLRRTNESLPSPRGGKPPVCLDIETDGLSPTVVWLVGLYDPATDEYTAVTERETPTDPARNVQRFCETFFARYADRTVLTWNGDRFDFPVLDEFVARHAPEYRDAWAEVWKADLYRWAVREGNALLPGRTNRLDDVARALGYEDAGTGLTGAGTAAAYRRFARDPGDPAAEPDWARHERYCEDDCRALWHVWEALERAERRDPTDAGTDAGGTQTGLTDF